MTDDLAATLLSAIETDRLVVLCGAGLSMAPPTSLPSAWRLSNSCAGQYAAITGIDLPADIRDDLEKLAEHFKSRNELQSLLIQKLISWDVFKKNPNAGHQALGDFLVSGIIELVVSTNYDILIELSATALGEPDFRAIIDQSELNRGHSAHRPLLKIHGCSERSRDDTVWCVSQLNEEPLLSRIPLLRDWLKERLKGSDLLVLGFWSDWSYLNKLLADSVSLAEPRNVIVVDPVAPAVLETKAPELWKWAHEPAVRFTHEQASAAEFLDELRKRFSKQFIIRLLKESISTFNVRFGNPPAVLTDIPEALSAQDLYDLRRDACGKPSGEVARTKRPEGSQALFGAMHLYLRAKGGTLNGSQFVLAGERVRLIQGAGQLLSSVRSRFGDEPPQPDGATITVCVASKDDGGVPTHIIRGGRVGGIVRGGTSGAWMTDDQLVAWFGDLV